MLQLDFGPAGKAPAGPYADVELTDGSLLHCHAFAIKGKEVEEEKQAMAEFGSSDSGASLGDILGAAIRRRNQQAQSES